jgi:hypothetical protein
MTLQGELNNEKLSEIRVLSGKVSSCASDRGVVFSFDVNASVEGGWDTSVDGFTEDVTDGLLDLSVNSFVKIVIWVNDALSVVLTAWFFSIELIINFSGSSSVDGVAIALIKVPVIISLGVWALSLSSSSEVVLSLVAGLVDFISLVGEGSSDVPVLWLSNVGLGVAFNVGGVGSIESVHGLDDLSWDDLFSSGNDDLGWDGISWCTWTSILNVDIVVAFFEVVIITLSFPSVVSVGWTAWAWTSSNAATLSSNSLSWTGSLQSSDGTDSVVQSTGVWSWWGAWGSDGTGADCGNTEYEEGKGYLFHLYFELFDW